MKPVAEVFDFNVKDYDGWFDTLQGKLLFNIEVDAVKRLAKRMNHPFLEIGVGTGRFAKKIGIDFGIDPSQKALRLAKRRGIQVKKASGEKLPFKDEFFGCVFILFTLCFVEDPGKVLAEAKRVLKPDGGLIVGLINRESPWGKLYLKKKEEGHPIYKHARFYNVKEVIEMMGIAGMQIEAYSSALLQPPSESPHDEAAYSWFKAGAGFICILAKKAPSQVNVRQETPKDA